MNRRHVIGFMLFLCAIAFLVMGFMRKEHHAVFSQATTICTECVGLQPGYQAPAPTAVPTQQPVFRLPLGVGK
ncbi:MAG: hypothetical protein IKJ51_02135 [Clostridia bacterium]|nr:hypothetical protein [Clostridia bacterium]